MEIRISDSTRDTISKQEVKISSFLRYRVLAYQNTLVRVLKMEFNLNKSTFPEHVVHSVLRTVLNIHICI